MLEKKGTCNSCGYEKKYCTCTNKFYEAEVDKLLLQQKQLRDNYNQETEEFDEYKYSRILRNSRNQEYSWNSGETAEQFYIKFKIHVDVATEKNIRLHMKGPKGPWYSHRRPDGCFMCKDVEIIGYCMDIIKYFVTKYPKDTIDITY